jgi:hypothetical protein
MDGRKFDWIRKQLGLSKVELAQAAWNISSKSLSVYLGRTSGTSCARDAGVMVPGSHGGIPGGTERIGRRDNPKAKRETGKPKIEIESGNNFLQM